jgi:hypothetical protein
MNNINLFEYPLFASFWEYRKAWEVLNVLEHKEDAGMISDHDHDEMKQLRMRITDYEKLNKID